jgi:DNA invertase Pin-like site-specific DNA recombinase
VAAAALTRGSGLRPWSAAGYGGGTDHRTGEAGIPPARPASPPARRTGALTDRPGLAQALSHLHAGDTLVVWRLDRLGRSLPHLIEIVAGLAHRGVGFRSLQEQIDTTTSGGRLVFHVFGALAEFERDLIRERIHAGLAAARARGRLSGRPRSLTPRKVEQLRTLAAGRRNSVAEICQTLGIARATFYRYVHESQPGR